MISWSRSAPGLGALTVPLLERLDHLHVVEIDRDLIGQLRRRFSPARLTIHTGDVLNFDFAALADTRRIKLVSNLPYNISSPLLFHLVRQIDKLGEIHFMLQKEVVDRIDAVPGGRDYGRLSVMLQYRFHTEKLFEVPAASFDPMPKVDSAMLRMIPKRLEASETARNEILFAHLVTVAFSQRRKMLRNTLKEFGGAAFLSAHGIVPTTRAENLTVADYVRLANALAETDGSSDLASYGPTSWQSDAIQRLSSGI